MNNSSLFTRIYEIVKTIPYGKVATYGQIACAAGNPRASRAVGWALHNNPDPSTIPCHRVVNRFGELSNAFAFSTSFGQNAGKDEHKARLEAEGVEIEDYTVDLEKYGCSI